MFRIFLAIVTLAACGTASAATPVSVAVEDSAVILQGQGDLAEVRHFALKSPPRLVVDLHGTRMADRQKNIPLANGFARLRVGSYPDKTRIVFDAAGDGIPSYTVSKGDRRVVVNWKKKAPRPAARAATVRPTAPGIRARVTSIEIDADQAAGAVPASRAEAGRHQVRIAVQPFAGLGKTKHFTLRAPGRLVVDLHGVRPGAHTRRFALGGGFQRLRVGDARDRTRLVFDLDGDHWPAFEIAEDPQRASIVVSWQAPASALPDTLAGPGPRPASVDAGEQRVASPAPPVGPVADVSLPVVEARGGEPARTYSDVRTTLVADDAEIRDVLARLAEVSGRRIVVDESVTGRLMLRLVDVPWDQALDMVVGIAGLRVVEEGDGLRVIGPPASGVGGPTTRELVGNALDGSP